MLLVTDVDGPARVVAEEEATFRVTGFNREDHSGADRVSWLVKTEGGVALTNVAAVGPVWRLRIPSSWAGETVFVMPYMHSATRSVAVRTEVEAADAPVPTDPVQVVVEEEDGRFYASVDGAPRFFVGAEVRYRTRRGLMNALNPYGPRYDPDAYEDELGDWSHYLWPTIACESRGAFNCINTYDRARFTYGHLQYAAHTPDDNLVVLLRELLGLPSARAYFPDLVVRDGRIHRQSGGGTVRLEDADDTAGLQDYLNPGAEEVEPGEVEVAARMMDWCARDAAFVDTLVRFGVRDQQAKLRRHARRLPLEGLSDKLCLVVLDILHQGRAGYRAITRALAEDDPFDALLDLGLHAYRERIATLRASLLELESRGIVGRRVYSQGGFVEADGA